jgi:hypothetical protein
MPEQSQSMEAWSKMYQEKIIDIKTGEEIIRPYTEQEIAELESANEAAQIQLERIANENSAKIAKRNEIFEKLGLSADEVEILFS